jgi:hypothetical protein
MKGTMVDIDSYRSILGKIMYYAPEICNAVRELAGHLSNPGDDHWKALERCVGYLAGERTTPLCLSVSGRINTLGVMITNWTSKKYHTVSLSSSEAEYQALSGCLHEAVFTQHLVEELTGQRKPAIIYEENLGTIFLVKNQRLSSRTKHIDVRHHFMRDLQDKKELGQRTIWQIP